MELFKLFGSILVDSDKADKSIANTEKKASGLGTELGKGIKTAALFGAALASGAAVAIGGMTKLVSSALDTTSEIEKFSQVTGHTTDAYQRWDTVMKNTGYSMEQASGDIAALGEKAMDAANGVGEGAELFDKLGVSVTDSSGKMKTQEDIFQETITALQGMEDVTERNAISSALLSTTGEELVPVLNMSNEELEKMKANANVISDDDLSKADKFKESWDKAKNTFSTVATTLGVQLMPAFQSFLEWIQIQMPKIQSFTETTFDVIETVMGNVSSFVTNNVIPILSQMKSWAESNLPIIRDFFLDAFNSARQVLADLRAWIEPNIPLIQQYFQDAFEKIVGIIGTFNSILNDKVIPSLVSLWEWIEPHLPLIKEVFETSFNAIKDAIQDAIDVVSSLAKKIEEHWAIVEPIIVAYVAIITTKLIVQWVKLGIQAVLSAAKQVVAWVMTQTAAIKSVAVHVATAIVMVARWVWMGAQSLIQAGRMAAAWLIAMGPVGWVIGIIVGLVALIILNWDKIVGATKYLGEKLTEIWTSTVNWITRKVNNMLTFFGGLKDRMASKVSGMWDGIKTSFKSAINWVIRKWNNFKLKLGGNKVNLPFGQSFTIPSMTLNTPNIPMLAKGGDITGAGRVLVGEKGPEFLDLPKGAKVTPLEKNNSSGITQHITINSPKELSPSEIKRKQLQASRQLAMEWGI